MTEDGQPSSVLSICKLLPQKVSELLQIRVAQQRQNLHQLFRLQIPPLIAQQQVFQLCVKALQFVADRRCNTLPLIVLMDIQPVQIAGLIHVPKTNNFAIFYCNDCFVRTERRIPRFQIHFATRPRIQLLLRIILRVHTVNSLVK